jgi:MFS family permease
MLQGAAVGGEVPGAWVFVGEHVPPSRAGLACVTLTAGLTAGILLGSLVAIGVNLVVSASQVVGDRTASSGIERHPGGDWRAVTAWRRCGER